MKEIDYAKKTHQSFFVSVCRVGTPLHLVHRRTKKLQPKRRGAKVAMSIICSTKKLVPSFTDDNLKQFKECLTLTTHAEENRAA